MRDKRPVDELSIEELERILAIRKREDRQKRLSRMKQAGRVIDTETNPPVQAIMEHRPPINAAAGAMALPAKTVTMPPSSVEKVKRGPQFEEDIGADEVGHPDKVDDSIWRKFVDRSLLLVEVASVAGLIIIGFVLFNAVGLLESKTREAQELANEQRLASLPTVEPTPQLRISQVVLPGGHTPPTGPNGGQFNVEEVPIHLRSLVQEQVLNPVIARPPVTDDTPLRLIIPKLNIDQTIVQGVDWEALKLGVGQVPNNATPRDERGNIVLAAHNDIYGQIFRYLDQLSVGDQFQIQTRAQVYTYTVVGFDIVDPTDVYVMDSKGAPTATLISCYPYQVNNKRYVIFAERSQNF